ncbi:MAG: dUTP diphosphatase [Paludibacteraceae bacterium]|nr:dUTP diphosphatase [Paludibacteraceae bacterium]
MNINIINRSDNPLPKYETQQAAGMDIRCFISQPVTLQPLERKLFPTGLYIELPEGYEAQIRPRSGLALKRGLTVLNTPGTIDADYRGEIGIILINLSGQPQTIEPGERIAQMVIAPCIQPCLVQVDEINQTTRGEGGFGHSGSN